MLRDCNQVSMCLNNYAVLYDTLIDKDNFWRQLKELKQICCLNIFWIMCQKKQIFSIYHQLIRQAKLLRKSVYKIDETMHDKMPQKRETTGLLEDQIEYTRELLKLIKDDVLIKHMDYMETEEFKELYAERYKIEEKNLELKINFGYDEANVIEKVGITD